MFQLIALYFVIISFLNNTYLEAHTLTKPLDLTWPFENSTIYWSGVRSFKLISIVASYNENNFWYAMNEFCAAEHGGTHLDAPYHFYKEGQKVGDIPLEKLITKGIIIDISKEVEQYGASTNLEVKHLNKWVEENGPIEENTVALIKFGWSKHYPDRTKYLGITKKDGKDKLNFPGLTAEAAQWLVDTNKVVGIGMDTASIDPGLSSTFDAHRIVNGHNMYILENIKLVEPLPARNFTLLVLPMNIAEGTGAPLRLVALPNNYI